MRTILKKRFFTCDRSFPRKINIKANMSEKLNSSLLRKVYIKGVMSENRFLKTK